MVIATPWRMHELHAEIQILIKGGYLKEKKRWNGEQIDAGLIK
jgi:hypothetical protein